MVFGHVIQGTNILNIFNNFQIYTGTQTSNLVADEESFNPAFGDLPLLYPYFVATNFVFIDITLMQVVITNGSGGEQISWNSATGLTNIVEFTTNLPPVWYTLITTNGTGARMTVTDPAPARSRFYRVRVPY